INAGTLSISADRNLGAVPSTATPAKVVLNGGTLQTTATFAIDSKRGIAAGPSSGTGTGALSITSGTLTYNGVIANNGSGTGNFAKTGSGIAILGGSNTYTGTTTIAGGTLRIGAAGALPTTSPIVVSSGSTPVLDLNNTSISVGSLTGSS